MAKSLQFALFSSVLFLTAPYGSNLPTTAEQRQLSVCIRAQPTQPAGVPILITLSVTNIGEKPYFYFQPTLRSYPPGSDFLAVITDDSGKVQESQMSNDLGGASAPGGSGGMSRLLHGESIDVPVCIDPLVAGSYMVEVRESKIAEGSLNIKTPQRTKIVVKNDPKLAKKWHAELLARIRKGERFAQYVAGTYPSNSLIELLLQELLSEDDQIILRAADPLQKVIKLPDSSVLIITKAMNKQLPGKQSDVRTSILGQLARLAGKIGTDDALEGVIMLARTEKVRGTAVWALGDFKQEKASEQLRLFLNDQNEELQFRAAQRLSERKDPQALEVLLFVAHDPKSRWRMYSFDALLKYRDDPRAEKAIKSGLDDSDSSVHQSAEFALRQLANLKKQNP